MASPKTPRIRNEKLFLSKRHQESISGRTCTVVTGKRWCEKTSGHVRKTHREQKWDVSAPLVRRPRQNAYLFPETHMRTHAISSQLKMKRAQRLREPDCLFKDEKLGKKSALSESVSSHGFQARPSLYAASQHSPVPCLTSGWLWFDHQSTQRGVSTLAGLCAGPPEHCLISQPHLLWRVESRKP